MRIFLDANILVSVLNKEYPLFSYSSRILSLTDNKKFEVFTSPVCLAIAFYFAEKKHKTKVARQKIGLLCENISIADITESAVQKIIKNSAWVSANICCYLQTFPSHQNENSQSKFQLSGIKKLK